MWERNGEGELDPRQLDCVETQHGIACELRCSWRERVTPSFNTFKFFLCDTVVTPRSDRAHGRRNGAAGRARSCAAMRNGGCEAGPCGGRMSLPKPAKGPQMKTVLVATAPHELMARRSTRRSQLARRPSAAYVEGFACARRSPRSSRSTWLMGLTGPPTSAGDQEAETQARRSFETWMTEAR